MVRKRKWEISMLEFKDRVKVTRRLPELSVAETKMFRDRKKAKRLFEEWRK